MNLRVVLLSGLSLLAVACSNDVERMVELEEAKAEGYEKAGDDCDAAAKAATEFREKYGTEHKELGKKLKEKYDGDKEGAEKAIEPYKDRMEKASKVVTKTVIKCMDNEAYAKAIKSD